MSWGWIAFGVMFLLWLLKGKRSQVVGSYKFPAANEFGLRPFGAIPPSKRDKVVSEFPSPKTVRPSQRRNNE